MTGETMNGNEVAAFIRHYQQNDGHIKDERYRCEGDKENILKSEWGSVANALDALVEYTVNKVTAGYTTTITGGNNS